MVDYFINTIVKMDTLCIFSCIVSHVCSPIELEDILIVQAHRKPDIVIFPDRRCTREVSIDQVTSWWCQPRRTRRVASNTFKVSFSSPFLVTEAARWRQMYVRNPSSRDPSYTTKRRWCSEVRVRSEPKIKRTSDPKPTLSVAKEKVHASRKEIPTESTARLNATAADTDTGEQRRTIENSTDFSSNAKHNQTRTDYTTIALAMYLRPPSGITAIGHAALCAISERSATQEIE